MASADEYDDYDDYDDYDMAALDVAIHDIARNTRVTQCFFIGFSHIFQFWS